MNIKYIDFGNYIKSGNCIFTDAPIERNSIYITKGDNAEFYKSVEWDRRGKGIASCLCKSPVINGVSISERDIFEERTSIYNEVTPLSEILQNYPNVTVEQAILGLNRVVEKMNFPAEKQNILKALFDGKTKKELVESGQATYPQIKDVAMSFYIYLRRFCVLDNEKRYIADFAAGIENGPLAMCYTGESFAKKHGIAKSLLDDICQKVLKNQKALLPEEAEYMKYALLAEDNSKLSSADVSHIYFCRKRVGVFYHNAECVEYERVVKKLLANNYTAEAIMRFATISGYNQQKLFLEYRAQQRRKRLEEGM